MKKEMREYKEISVVVYLEWVPEACGAVIAARGHQHVLQARLVQALLNLLLRSPTFTLLFLC